MNKKIIIIGILVLVSIVIVVALNIFSSEKSTIKIGGAFVLTGPVAILGELQVNAANMAVEDVNAQGGINGRKIELIIEDSAFDPKTALNAYQALKLKGVKYIIADGSPVVSSIRPAALKDGNLIFAVGATTPGYFDGSDLSCRIALTAKNFGPAFTQLLEKKGYKSVVALLPDNEYGHGLYDEFTKAFTANGGKIIAVEFYNTTSTAGDYRTNITKLKSFQGDVDAMIVLQVSNTVEPMLKQIKELGWYKSMVSDYYMINNPALKELSLANGIDFIDYQYSRESSLNESETEKTFKEKYTAKFGSAPVFIGAGHYDVTKLIIEGIKNAGDNPQKVANYISKLKNYEAVTGNISFNDDCEVSRDTVFRTVQDGKIIDLK